MSLLCNPYNKLRCSLNINDHLTFIYLMLSSTLIDEIGYTPIEKREANLFFTMISEMYEKKSIIVTSNKSFDAWAEMMGDSVMTTALLDRLLHHARVFNLDGDSYRIKNQKKEV